MCAAFNVAAPLSSKRKSANHNATTFKLTGRIHAPYEITGIVVDPSTSYLNVALENAVLAALK